MQPEQVFRSAYLAATYFAENLAISFSATPTGQVLFAGRRFALISAQNPRSTPLEPDENLARNAMLTTVFWSKGWEYADSYGGNADLSWKEAGFIVWDVPCEDVIEIAKQFDQNAIMFGEADKIALCWCFLDEIEWFYPSVKNT